MGISIEVQCERCGQKQFLPYDRKFAECKCGNTWEALPIRGAARPGSALDIQEGGGHYKDQPIQPVEYIHANAIGYFEGNVIKYVSRWRKKNGLEDLKKAKHYIELLIELEQKKEQA